MTRPGGSWQNWARTARARPVRVERPRSTEAVQRAVRAAARQGLRVKAVGSGHSFSAIAAADGVLLDLEDLSGLVHVDTVRQRVRLKAGTRLADIPRLLRPHRLAMPNLGDIDVQTLAGAISTGTHGTGAAFGGLATQVVGLAVVTGDGELVEVDADSGDGLLAGAVVGLGALGIVVEVELQCVPAFVLHAVEAPEPLDAVLEHVHQRFRNADHFEFYWFPHTDRALTRTNTRLPAGAETHPLSAMARWVDERLVGGALHQSAVSVMRVAPATAPRLNRLATRVWGDREFSDASHRVFPSPRPVRFQEMEYAVPVEYVRPAFDAVRALIDDEGWRVSFPIEVRVAAPDGLWLSTAYRRPSAYIAVHRYWREDATAYFEGIEEIMRRFGGRPHWGKVHALEQSELRELYPRFDDFLALRDEWDPARIFANEHLERVLGV